MLWVERLHHRMSKSHCNFSNLLKPESSVFKGLIYQYICPSSVIPICQYYTRLCYLQATYLRRLRAYSSVTAQVLSDVFFTHTLFSSIKYKDHSSVHHSTSYTPRRVIYTSQDYNTQAKTFPTMPAFPP